ncbi:MAG TPA: prolyl oligopeptidase family serine peptidase [Verrucomicrobiota bacterium]|nr:S9 family peptidase [Verrucomicrobiales bacterium]HRI15036.1 prolyl oligopeptidase family serine peptidase [Verrucomicrobiota bacterium]
MKFRWVTGTAAAAGLAGIIGCISTPTVKHESLAYPASTISNVVDVYHGTRVSDPYRWLEDENSGPTRAWIEAQNAVTFDFLERLPEREPLQHRLSELYVYDRYGVPVKQGARYFFTRAQGLQNQTVLYSATALNEPPTVLLDPNLLAADGTVALKAYAPSDDGTKIAYALSMAGSDWEEWRVRDVATGQDTGDVLNWVKFSACGWTVDGLGFFYSRYDAPPEGEKLSKINEFQKLYYHRLGTPQTDDVLVYHRADQPKWGFTGLTTEDGRYLVIPATEGTDTKNRVFFKDLTRANAPVEPLLTDFDASYNFAGNIGTTLFFLTDLNAPRGRLIAIDVAHPEREHWREIIPQSDATLEAVRLVGGRFVGLYLRDAYSEVKLFDLQGNLERQLALPGIGTVSGFSGRQDATETFFAFASFTSPTRILRHNFIDGTTSLWKAPDAPFNPADYETKQVFYKSKDGTRIPMFLSHKKGHQPNGRTPVLLYGYGGFNISLSPSFAPANLLWMELGGIYAVPNLRGGGEYGEDWHQAGTKLIKQNVFDDFIGAAEWLIAERYTTPRRLAISGGSNGGLLVGASMVQRPKLFGACLPAVGVMDMLRFHKFTIGWAWVSDYGSSERPDEFKALYAYSPYHNLKPNTCYPPTLITTGDHDDRVVPAHSFKFAARLQAVQDCNNPVLIRIETRAGHGAGKPTTKIIEESADRLAFIAHELSVPVPPIRPVEAVPTQIFRFKN